jgi:hypothetical protein
VAFRSVWCAVLLAACAAAPPPPLRLVERPGTTTDCLPEQWCVIGSVVDDATSRPIRNAQVLMLRTGCIAATDSTGTFNLTCSEPPSDTVGVRAIGYVVLRHDVRIRAGHQYVAQIRLKPAPPRGIIEF